jgi:hypothetical protein
MPTLATAVDGLKLPNPFVIASGPPGTNLNVISRAFREGWGAVIAKTVILDSCLVASGEKEGAKVLCDGRDAQVADAPNGLFVGATIVDQVQNEMALAREEVFGPVLNVMRMEDRSGDGADEQILLWQRRRHFY